MLFLFLRILPYFLPVLYFLDIKLVFTYNDLWPYLLAINLLLPLLYFGLLKYKNRSKAISLLLLYALIYAFAGFAYVIVLENPLVINLFLIGWSLIYWFYLEAVFHDFYETEKTPFLNLANITLYGNILVIFFLTAAAVAFDIFLNFPWLPLLLFLIASYFVLIYLALNKQDLGRPIVWLYSLILTLIMGELFTALLFLPSSFYVLASLLALTYYFFTYLIILSAAGKLKRRSLAWFSLLVALVAIAILATAAWF